MPAIAVTPPVKSNASPEMMFRISACRFRKAGVLATPHQSRCAAFWGLRGLRVGGSCRPCEDVPAGRLLRFAPLGRRDAHMVLEGALERRFGLVPDRLRHGAGGKLRSLQLVRCERHPDIR